MFQFQTINFSKSFPHTLIAEVAGGLRSCWELKAIFPKVSGTISVLFHNILPYIHLTLLCQQLRKHTLQLTMNYATDYPFKTILFITDRSGDAVFCLFTSDVMSLSCQMLISCLIPLIVGGRREFTCKHTHTIFSKPRIFNYTFYRLRLNL